MPRCHSAWLARTNQADTATGLAIVAGQRGDVYYQALISLSKFGLVTYVKLNIKGWNRFWLGYAQSCCRSLVSTPDHSLAFTTFHQRSGPIQSLLPLPDPALRAMTSLGFDATAAWTGSIAWCLGENR